MKHSKMLKKDFAKKLGSYSAAAGAVLALGNTANAQINYTADTRAIFNGITIDIDNSGTPDLSLTTSTTSTGAYSWMNMQIMGGADVSSLYAAKAFPTSIGGSDGGDVGALPLNYVIKTTFASGNWGSFDTIGSKSYSDGNFDNAGFINTTRYVGVKFKKAGVVHFAWIGLKLSGARTGIIQGHAWQKTMNTSIKAGDMGTPPAPVPVPISPIAVASAMGLIGLFAFLRRRKAALK